MIITLMLSIIFKANHRSPSQYYKAIALAKAEHLVYTCRAAVGCYQLALRAYGPDPTLRNG